MDDSAPEGITPALASEQWTEWLGSGEIDTPIFAALMHSGADPGRIQLDASNTGHYIASGERHALAALCLWGTPQGFTHEDVNLCLEAMKSMSFKFNDPIAIKYSDLARRLKALLPPEDSRA